VNKLSQVGLFDFDADKIKEKKQYQHAIIQKKTQNIPSNVFREEINEIKKEETYAVVNVNRIVATTLEKSETSLTVTFEHWITPYPQEMSHYGGFCKFSDYHENTATDFLNDAIQFKRELLSLPYLADLKNAYKYTNLKAENVFINISEDTKKFIESKSGRKWEDFLAELNNIKNKEIPPDYCKKIEKETALEKEILLKEKKILSLKKEYTEKLEDKNTLMQRNSSVIFNDFKKTKAELNSLKKELQETINQINNSIAQ
jgi:hypothetical protein